MSDVIALTGASGQLCRRVVRHLAGAGAAVRLVVRDPARAPQIPGAHVAAAAYEDERAMVAALDGTRTVFLVSAPEGWVSSYYAVATGETSVTSHTVERVTGVRPWTIAEFLHNEPDSWAHLAQ